MANPLIRSSHAALMARRPLGTVPGLRFMSTTRPPIRMQSVSWPALKTLDALPPRNVQYRSFGNSNLVPHHLLSRTEAAANRNPQSAPTQASFYQLLLKANMPAIVVERYQSGMSFPLKVMLTTLTLPQDALLPTKVPRKHITRRLPRLLEHLAVPVRPLRESVSRLQLLDKQLPLSATAAMSLSLLALLERAVRFMLSSTNRSVALLSGGLSFCSGSVCAPTSVSWL